MIEDDKIIGVTREMDDFLFQMAQKYGLSNLSLSAIALARLMRLTMEDSSDTDFRKLMSEALQNTSQTQITRTLQ